MYRYKTIFGSAVRARTFDNQVRKCVKPRRFEPHDTPRYPIFLHDRLINPGNGMGPGRFRNYSCNKTIERSEFVDYIYACSNVGI